SDLVLCCSCLDRGGGSFCSFPDDLNLICICHATGNGNHRCSHRLLHVPTHLAPIDGDRTNPVVGRLQLHCQGQLAGEGGFDGISVGLSLSREVKCNVGGLDGGVIPIGGKAGTDHQPLIHGIGKDAEQTLHQC